DYIRFGCVNGRDVVVEPRAQCVECVLKLSNEALKPLNLNRHLEATSSTHVQNQVLERMKGSPFLLKQVRRVDGKAALVLFFVRYHWSGILQESMVFCGELRTQTTAQECSVLFMLIIDCSHRFKSLFQLFESLSIFWVYSGFISLLVCCAQISLGLLQLSSFVSKLFWIINPF